MKKFLSMLLAIALVLSLAAPAMAAEPTVTGEREGEVNASYDPEIFITGYTIKNYQDNDVVKVDEANKQYIITIPKGIYSTAITVSVTGQNLHMIPSDVDDYFINSAVGSIALHGDTEFDVAVYSSIAGTSVPMKFSNSGVLGPWTMTGWTMVFKQYYDITNATAADAKGTVTIANEASVGDTVELFVSAEEGYQLDTLSVMNGDTAVEVSDNHTFVMPAANVTVTATFKEAAESYSISIVETQNGTVTANKTEGIHAGDDVTLTVTPVDGYQLDELTLSYEENGEIKYLTYSDTYTFVMPPANVTVTANFEKIPVPSSITVSSSENGTVSPDAAEAIPGTTVTLTVTPDDGYQLKELQINGGVVTPTKVNDTTYTFVMPEEAVTVTAAFEKIPYTVTVADSEYGSVTADKQTAGVGETVTLTWSADTGYELDSIVVTDAANNTVLTNQGVVNCTFTMPASNVTVTAYFKVQPIISVEITWGSMNFTFTDGENGAQDGTWSNDGSDKAATVTVTNTGNATIKVTAAYAAASEEYSSIIGSLGDDQNLEPTQSGTFTLTLSGAPTKAITAGTKIGTVTVTISENTGVTTKQHPTISLAEGKSLTQSSVESIDLTTMFVNSANLPMTFSLFGDASTGSGSLEGSVLKITSNGSFLIRVTTSETDDYYSESYDFEITVQ